VSTAYFFEPPCIFTLRHVTDRNVRINVTLRFLTLRYVTWE